MEFCIEDHVNVYDYDESWKECLVFYIVCTDISDKSFLVDFGLFLLLFTITVLLLLFLLVIAYHDLHTFSFSFFSLSR